jgi:hypothetical protein
VPAQSKLTSREANAAGSDEEWASKHDTPAKVRMMAMPR